MLSLEIDFLIVLQIV